MLGRREGLRARNRKAVPSGMSRTLDKVEMLSILSIQLGWDSLFQSCCELLVNGHKWQMERLSALPKALGKQMYQFGKVDNANLYMTHSRQDKSWNSQYDGMKGPGQACDRIIEGYVEAKLKLA